MTVSRGIGRGGYRPTNPGGRPKGSKTRHIKRVAVTLAKAQITPLEFAINLLNSADASIDDKKWACTVSMPYVHPRLAPKLIIERRVLDPDELTDEELLAAVRDLEQRLASGKDDEDENEPKQRQATAPPQTNGHDPEAEKGYTIIKSGQRDPGQQGTAQIKSITGIKSITERDPDTGEVIRYQQYDRVRKKLADA